MTPPDAAPPLSPILIAKAVSTALEEDLGLAGDVTTNACVPANARARCMLAARSAGVVAGVDVARAAFEVVDGALEVRVEAPDGSTDAKGAAVMRVDGSARAILTAERTALNFLGRLSGVATATRALVDAVDGTGARIVCTRKTTPGLRALEKYAVRCGGGANHRFGLFDAIMIKDNHIAAAGGLTAAVGAARRAVGHMVKIELEVDTLEQFDEALALNVDVVLLDNMTTDQLREAVGRATRLAEKRPILEASGGVALASARAIAETGVDVISSGAITHSAPCLDLGLDFI